MHRLSSRLCLAFAALASLLAAGCEIINPAEELPAYLSIQSPQVVLDEGTGFATNAGIRNVWVYHGGFLQGVYQIDPAVDTNGRVLPVLQLSSSDYFLEGGIYETGLSAFQIAYPFWDRVTFDWDAPIGDTLVVTPQFHYIDPAFYVLEVNEQFEGGAINFNSFSRGLTQSDSTFFHVRYDAPFQGNGYGRVDFDADNRWFEVVNTTPFRSDQSKNIFAEITYQNDLPFHVGMVYQTQDGTTLSKEIVTVNPSPTWNTIYVHMIKEVRDIINANGANTDLWLWIWADGEDKTGYIKFDDIRVIREN